MKTGNVLLQELRYMLDEPTEVKWLQIIHLYPELTIDRTAGYRFHPSNLTKYRFEQMALQAPVSTDREYHYEFQGQGLLKFVPAVNQEMKMELHYEFDPSDIVGPTDVDQVPEFAYFALKLFAKHLAYQAIAHPDTEKIYASWDAEIKKLQQYVNPRKQPTFPSEVDRKQDSMLGTGSGGGGGR
jgi:hypothetical protein